MKNLRKMHFSENMAKKGIWSKKKDDMQKISKNKAFGETCLKTHLC